MKAIMVMFDSLNRHMLPPYGCDWVHAPNFQRLAERTVTFESAYAGSMPCMPARREIHTGRYNFLHRSWGPIEPYDNSMPESLKNAGVYTHLISDHYHYWEEGGANYHTRYNTWEISRGQEGDPWIADLNDPEMPQPNVLRSVKSRQDWVNRAYMQDENDQPQAKTFNMGVDFIKKNHKHDNWFVQIETFDPHEPYFVNDKYKRLYKFDFSKFNEDWPRYARVPEDQQELAEHYRYCNAALISMCDYHLGRVLDMMDQYDLWKDTMLIVNTDHGFLLGEHGWCGKSVMPFYQEVINIPMFIWDPRSSKRNERRRSLVQTIDLAPTLLDLFGVSIPDEMQGVPLRKTVADDTTVREAGLFGVHGGHVNVTDGRYVYMRAPIEGGPLYEYTLMPTHMRRTFELEEMRKLEELAKPFNFTKGCRTMKIPSTRGSYHNSHTFGNLLFDVQNDPMQKVPLQDITIESRMIELLRSLMIASDTPAEQFLRLGLA